MSDDYLVMARVMKREMDKWTRENISNQATGMEIIKAKDAYQAGFMAGFYLKFTKADERV